jgi:2-C-methyl-D-erythritol 2,4-cyclodiphosphate synthase
MMRIGFGYDSHRLVEGRKLILGGIEIPGTKGLLGHSDADVLVHAICDAILGAVAAADIGRHFPDTDQAYKDIDSLKLLGHVQTISDEKGFLINNIDSTVVLEKPKIADYLHGMTVKIADTLCIAEDRVNIKAKTNEGMGLIGRGEGVIAFAIVTVMEKTDM